MSLMTNNGARQAIMQSIRAHLAESALVSGGEPITVFSRADDKEFSAYRPETSDSLVKMFSERLESVGGNCVVARDEDQAARLLTQIISDLNQNGAAKRVAVSDAPLLSALTRGIAVEELDVSPAVAKLFDYDVGVTTTQTAIAETGTLILEAEKEQNRLISLLPPVHIAIMRSEDICLTIGDALARLRGDGKKKMSRAITFITGPSRTADIELTLTVGVHGPKELYVIIIKNDERT